MQGFLRDKLLLALAVIFISVSLFLLVVILLS